MTDQPNTLPTAEAARYVGARSSAQFLREVKAGTWPQPIAPNSKPRRWSTAQLDAVLAVDQSAEADPGRAWLDARFGHGN